MTILRPSPTADREVSITGRAVSPSELKPVATIRCAAGFPLREIEVFQHRGRFCSNLPANDMALAAAGGEWGGAARSERILCGARELYLHHGAPMLLFANRRRIDAPSEVRMGLTLVIGGTLPSGVAIQKAWPLHRLDAAQADVPRMTSNLESFYEQFCVEFQAERRLILAHDVLEVEMHTDEPDVLDQLAEDAEQQFREWLAPEFR